MVKRLGLQAQRNRGERQVGLQWEDGLFHGSSPIPYVSRLKAFKKNENVTLCQNNIVQILSDMLAVSHYSLAFCEA